MFCPRCRTPLSPTTYEGVKVDQCTSCEGFFVEKKKLDAIKRRYQFQVDSLGKQASSHKPLQPSPRSRCPHCRCRMEVKRKSKPVPFEIDHCWNCKGYWLDAGELALLQISFENSYRGRDLRRFRDRLKSMSFQEKAEYEHNLSKLKHKIHDPSERSIWDLFDWL